MTNHESHKNVHKGWWIPVELNRFGLTKIEQLFLSIIDSLDDPEFHCIASNAYLAEQMGLSLSRISYYITKLKRLGLIQEISFTGRRRTIRSCKEKWYAKELMNSKKESYVKTRSLPTRKQVVCLRENTHHIIKGIEKKIIDEEVPANAGESQMPKKIIFFKHVSKNVISKEESSVIAYLQEKGYTDSEIKNALVNANECDPILRANNGYVIERYLAATIDKLREKNIREKKTYDYKSRDTSTHNRQQDSIQRSGESFRRKTNDDKGEERREGFWSFDGKFTELQVP